MDRFSAIAAAMFVCVLAGCADDPQEAPSASILATKYDGHNCQQIAAEQQRVSTRTAELSSIEAQQEATDVAVTAATALLLPIWVSPGVDENVTAEIEQLKAESSALELAASQKKCGAAPAAAASPAPVQKAAATKSQ